MRTVAGVDPGARTRGFLFADLRGYTEFVESAGANAGADLLERYRVLVREEVRRYHGAEIRTEGDSFYVVLPSASVAVQCGLAIVTAARKAAEASWTAPIWVGIGVHAGEAIETPEGPVGTAINMAARLCALAAPGEVLVSDTVRSLTRSILPMRYVQRGRRRLKGVAEPVGVFLALAPIDVSEPNHRILVARWLVAAVVLFALLLAVALALGIVRLPTAGPLLLGPSGTTPWLHSVAPGLQRACATDVAMRRAASVEGCQRAMGRANPRAATIRSWHEVPCRLASMS